MSKSLDQYLQEERDFEESKEFCKRHGVTEEDLGWDRNGGRREMEEEMGLHSM